MSTWTSITVDDCEGITTAALTAALVTYSDLDESWVEDTNETESSAYIGYDRKWATKGIRDVAVALSYAHPDAVVTLEQEWDDDGAGGERWEFIAGRLTKTWQKDWHLVSHTSSTHEKEPVPTPRNEVTV